MLPLSELQRRFRDVSLGGDAGLLSGVILGDGLSAEARLNIHRNNTTILLGDALAATFKVCHKLVGDDFFAAVARLYVRTHPPQNPCLYTYGEDFADFLGALPQIESVAYLPDVARLEWLWNEAFHAADVPTLNATALVDVPPESYADLTFTPHPALRLVASPYPIKEIWAINQDTAPCDATVDLDEGGQSLAIVRPASQVEMLELSPAGFVLATHLADGARLETAFAAAIEIDADFDPTATLTILLSAGAFENHQFKP